MWSFGQKRNRKNSLSDDTLFFFSNLEEKIEIIVAELINSNQIKQGDGCYELTKTEPAAATPPAPAETTITIQPFHLSVPVAGSTLFGVAITPSLMDSGFSSRAAVLWFLKKGIHENSILHSRICNPKNFEKIMK